MLTINHTPSHDDHGRVGHSWAEDCASNFVDAVPNVAVDERFAAGPHCYFATIDPTSSENKKRHLTHRYDKYRFMQSISFLVRTVSAPIGRTMHGPIGRTVRAPIGRTVSGPIGRTVSASIIFFGRSIEYTAPQPITECVR